MKGEGPRQCWNTPDALGFGRGGSPSPASPPDRSHRNNRVIKTLLCFVLVKGRFWWASFKPEVGGREAGCEAVLFWGHFASCFLLAASSPLFPRH